MARESCDGNATDIFPMPHTGRRVLFFPSLDLYSRMIYTLRDALIFPSFSLCVQTDMDVIFIDYVRLCKEDGATLTIGCA